MKAIVTAFVLAAITVPAVAAPAVASTAVDTADLDLKSQDGQKVLALRIHRAARAMCAADAADSLPQMMRNHRRCMQDATSSAMAAARTTRAARKATSGDGWLPRVARSN